MIIVFVALVYKSLKFVSIEANKHVNGKNKTLC